MIHNLPKLDGAAPSYMGNMWSIAFVRYIFFYLYEWLCIFNDDIFCSAPPDPQKDRVCNLGLDTSIVWFCLGARRNPWSKRGHYVFLTKLCSNKKTNLEKEISNIFILSARSPFTFEIFISFGLKYNPSSLVFFVRHILGMDENEIG